MNNKLILVVFLVVSIINFPSCKKYLDRKTSNTVQVPTTLSDLQALLDDGRNLTQAITPSFGEASADDVFLVDDDYSTISEQGQDAYKWMPFDNYRFPNDWSANYQPIYIANYCLEQVNNITKNTSNQSQWDNVKGSALFFRAFFFSQLVWTFSKAYDSITASKDLGIALRLTSDFNAPSVRSSVQDAYDRIISDATESINYLPDLPIHVMRPSKSAAYGLLARVYLSMRKYDSALQKVNLCLQLKSDLMDFNGDGDIINPIDDVNPPFNQFNKETIFYSEMSFNYEPAISVISNVDTLLYNSYENNDLRKLAYFTPNQVYSQYQQFKGAYTAGFILFSGIATDEMFLIKAECLARSGNRGPALNELNSLLSKRYDQTFVQVNEPDNNATLSKILTERRKELLMRGLRFIDIKRLNKEGANIVPKRVINGQIYSIKPNDDKYALPLPKTVTSLSGMPQNPYE